MSLEKRIEDLEKRYGALPGEELDPAERDRRRVEFLALIERVREKAEREAAQGDTRRLSALEEILESIETRRIPRGA